MLAAGDGSENFGEFLISPFTAQELVRVWLAFDRPPVANLALALLNSYSYRGMHTWWETNPSESPLFNTPVVRQFAALESESQDFLGKCGYYCKYWSDSSTTDEDGGS